MWLSATRLERSFPRPAHRTVCRGSGPVESTRSGRRPWARSKTRGCWTTLPDRGETCSSGEQHRPRTYATSLCMCRSRVVAGSSIGRAERPQRRGCRISVLHSISPCQMALKSLVKNLRSTRNERLHKLEKVVVRQFDGISASALVNMVGATLEHFESDIGATKRVPTSMMLQWK